jgi:hypothetical protein
MLTILRSQYIHLQKEMVAPRQHRHQGLELGRGAGMHVEDEPEPVGEFGKGESCRPVLIFDFLVWVFWTSARGARISLLSVTSRMENATRMLRLPSPDVPISALSTACGCALPSGYFIFVLDDG